MRQFNPRPDKGHEGSESITQPTAITLDSGCHRCQSHRVRRYARSVDGRTHFSYKCARCGQPIDPQQVTDPAVETPIMADGGTAVDQPTDSDSQPDEGDHRPDYDADLGIPTVFETALKAELWVRIKSDSGTEIIRHTDDGWQARHRRADGKLVGKVFDLEPFALQQRTRNHDADQLTVIRPSKTPIRFDTEEA